jgi:hypothetical protein
MTGHTASRWEEKKKLNESPRLTKAEKAALIELGNTLGIPDLAKIFRACAKAYVAHGPENPAQPNTISICRIDGQEDIVASGYIAPERTFANAPRHVRITFTVRHATAGLFSLSFAQAKAITPNGPKQNRDEMVYASCHLLPDMPVIRQIGLNVSELPAAQNLTKRLIKELSPTAPSV